MHDSGLCHLVSWCPLVTYVGRHWMWVFDRYAISIQCNWLSKWTSGWKGNTSVTFEGAWETLGDNEEKQQIFNLLYTIRVCRKWYVYQANTTGVIWFGVRAEVERSPSVWFCFSGGWMAKQNLVLIYQIAVETFQSGWEFLYNLRLIKGPSWNIFPGSCTPLPSLINWILTTLSSAIQPYIRSQWSQSTCTVLSIC